MIPFTERSALSSDFDFVFALHRLTYRVYVEALWGWDEAFQAQGMRRDFERGTFRILERGDGVAFGAYSVEQQLDGLYLRYLAVDPGHQGQGIGSRVVGVVLDRARLLGVPVRLRVLRGNPAFRLYQRLGFVWESGHDLPSRSMLWGP